MPLIQLFLDICLFRKGPQDLPASKVLLKLVLAAYFFVGLLQTLLGTRWLEGVLQVLLQAGILFGFVWISLKAAGMPERLPQTLTAMLGTDALISSFSLPLALIALLNPQDALTHLLLLLLMLWQTAVVAHILRHALSQTLAIGVVLSIVYMVFTLQILMLLFGAPADPG